MSKKKENLMLKFPRPVEENEADDYPNFQSSIKEERKVKKVPNSPKREKTIVHPPVPKQIHSQNFALRNFPLENEIDMMVTAMNSMEKETQLSKFLNAAKKEKQVNIEAFDFHMFQLDDTRKEKQDYDAKVSRENERNHKSTVMTKDIHKTSIFADPSKLDRYVDSTKEKISLCPDSNYNNNNKERNVVQLKSSGDYIDLLNVDIDAFIKYGFKRDPKEETFTTNRTLSPRVLREAKRLSPNPSPQSQVYRSPFFKLNADDKIGNYLQLSNRYEILAKESKDNIAHLEENIEAHHKELLRKGIM